MFRGSTTHERKGDLQGKKRSANVYMYSIVTHNNKYPDQHRFVWQAKRYQLKPSPTNNLVLDSRCVRTRTRGITVTTTTISGTPFPSFHPPLPIPGPSNPY